MNLTSVKCTEATKHPLHHPHFLCHSPDQSTGPSSFWNFPHSLRSKHLHDKPYTSNRQTEHTWRVEMPPELRPPSSSHAPSVLTWDPEQEEPQELSRESHVQKFELRSPDKSEQDQSWAFISDLQGKVLPGEPHANPLVGQRCRQSQRRVGGIKLKQSEIKLLCV